MRVKNALLEDEKYDPVAVLTEVKKHMGLRNNAALCREMQLAPPIVSKIKNKKYPITASVLLRFHDVSGIAISRLREVGNIPIFQSNPIEYD